MFNQATLRRVTLLGLVCLQGAFSTCASLLSCQLVSALEATSLHLCPLARSCFCRTRTSNNLSSYFCAAQRRTRRTTSDPWIAPRLICIHLFLRLDPVYSVVQSLRSLNTVVQLSPRPQTTSQNLQHHKARLHLILVSPQPSSTQPIVPQQGQGRTIVIAIHA